MMMSMKVSSSWHRELNPDKGWLQRQIAAWKVFLKMMSKGCLGWIQFNLPQATNQNAKISVAYRRWSLMRMNHRGSISGSGPDMFTFLQTIFLSYIQCSSILSLKVLHILWVAKFHTMRQVDAYKRLKTMKNYKTIMPKSGYSRLWKVIIYKKFPHRALTEKILVFWILTEDVLGRWSIKRCLHNHGGSTVLLQISKT